MTASMGSINKKWHANNPMPERANFDERLAWHARHAKACACRKMPTRTAAELAKRVRAKRKAMVT